VSAALLSAPVWAGALLTARQLLGAIRPEQSDVGALLTPIVIPLGALLAAAAASLLWIKRLSRRIVVVAALGGIAPILALVCAQPILHSMYPWEVLGAKIPPGHGRLWLVGRRAPSLTFYARRSVFTVPNADSLGTLMEHEREGWLALTRDDWTQLSRPGASTQVHATVVAERGRMLLVRFYGCGSYAGSGPRTARCP
jgi:hypothetical protein